MKEKQISDEVESVQKNAPTSEQTKVVHVKNEKDRN